MRRQPAATPCGALLLAASLARLAAAEPAAEQIDFFETKVRPVFAEHCYSCHSGNAKKLKGGLRLDTPEALLKGGKSGPVIEPGNPEASLLIKAVRYTDRDLRMPPKDKKLPAQIIASLEAWVQMGAPLPQSAAGGRGMADVATARARHWAFQPVRKPPLPLVKRADWVKTPVDNFILAMLEKNRLQPAAAADRRTLIRRVTYDLTGLPPTLEEVQSFIADQHADAYPQLVERLLASPHYGERWGRHWLDVARYADTKGYLAGGEERRYAFSYTYRDYVIRAFNDDKPYDQFVIEQIAADQLPLGEDKQPLAALGFLTLGRRFLNNRNDIIDDRIDVVSRGTLALTVTCARCHDHKFDPISTKDYYALHGVFASSEEPAQLPLLGPLRDSADYQDYLRQREKIEAEISEFKRKEVEKFKNELRQHVGDYLLGAHDAAILSDPAKFETFAGEHKLNPTILRRWMHGLEARSQRSDTIFEPWLRRAPLKDFRSEAASALAKVAADTALNPLVSQALSAATNSLKDVAEAYTKLFKSIDADWKAAVALATNQPPPTGLPAPERETLRQVLYAESEPINLPVAEAEAILAQPIRDGTAPIRDRIEALNWTHRGAPPRAMALADRASPSNSHVLLRGNPGTPGEEAPRRFLRVLSAPQASTFTNGSGRLELARAIVSRDNPLTARVYVNRVWLNHFGEGLVNTPGDFGVRTEEPVHRALLDYLAASFMEHDWSTKYLHRLILLSATYQQASETRSSSEPSQRSGGLGTVQTRASGLNSRSTSSLTTDPDNLLLAHMTGRRLDFEALRDTLLLAAGRLDPTIGGLPVDLETEPFSTRRTVYGLVDRQNLPGLFRTFDFPNPDTSSQKRFHTTVPQQALFLMNSPFVVQQALHLAQREEVSRAAKAADKIQALYLLVLQRRASESEIQLGERFLAGQSPSGSTLSPLEKYAQVLLLSNEVMFVD